MDPYEKQSKQKTVSPATQLAIIGGALSTLGDALATVATVLAIQEEAEKGSQIYFAIENMQKQIDELHKEIRQIKKMLKNNRF